MIGLAKVQGDPAGNRTLYGYDTGRGLLTTTVTPEGTATGTTATCTPPA